ncbi:MAG: TVP38/TMEM64 family protein [Promethearchaeota archaeon]
MAFSFQTWLADIIEWLVQLVEDIGPIGLFFAMIIQAIISPIPSEFLLGLGGAAFTETYGVVPGLTLAIIFGSLGSMVGAIICFYIAKKGGRPLVKRIVDEKTLQFADGWFQQNGFWAVLIGRLIPFIPFDAVSYGSGIAEIQFRDFYIASAIGVIPRAIFYCTLGYWTHGEIERAPTIGLSILFLIIAFLVILYYVILKRLSNQGMIVKVDGIDERFQES